MFGYGGLAPENTWGVPLSLSLHSGFDKKHHTQTVTDLTETVKKMLWPAFVDMLVWHGVPERLCSHRLEAAGGPGSLPPWCFPGSCGYSVGQSLQDSPAHSP